MNDITKLGALATFVGFLMVGSSILYAVSATVPNTLDGAQQAAQNLRDALTVQGLGWIIAGTGLAVGLYGLAARDTTIEEKVGSESETFPRNLPTFVCSACEKEFVGYTTICPHCGEPFEAEQPAKPEGKDGHQI